MEQREGQRREQQHVLAALEFLAKLDAKQRTAHENRVVQGAGKRAQGGAESARGGPAR